jgi:hypothetical protein
MSPSAGLIFEQGSGVFETTIPFRTSLRGIAMPWMAYHFSSDESSIIDKRSTAYSSCLFTNTLSSLREFSVLKEAFEITKS